CGPQPRRPLAKHRPAVMVLESREGPDLAVPWGVGILGAAAVPVFAAAQTALANETQPTVLDSPALRLSDGVPGASAAGGYASMIGVDRAFAVQTPQDFSSLDEDNLGLLAALDRHDGPGVPLGHGSA